MGKWTIAVLLFTANCAWAQNRVDLSTRNGTPTEQQTEMKRNLQAGDVLVFTDTKGEPVEFVFQKWLSTVTSFIAQATDSHGRTVALRTNTTNRRRNYVAETVNAYPAFRQARLPVPELYETDGKDYASMRYLEVKFDLSYIPFDLHDQLKNSGELDAMKKQLVDFVVAASQFSSIGDMDRRQIAWTTEGLFLLDWLTEGTRVWDRSANSLFQYPLINNAIIQFDRIMAAGEEPVFLTYDLSEEANRRVLEFRRRHVLPLNSCKGIFAH